MVLLDIISNKKKDSHLLLVENKILLLKKYK
jgi:hypothetical protein